MKPEISIATFSWARTADEKVIVLRALKKLASFGLPVTVVDQARSRFPLEREAGKIKNIRLFKLNKHGLDSQARKSFQEAAKLGDYIFYTESDKLDFIENHAERFLKEFYKNPRGMLLPARSKASFLRYPIFQQEMERFLWKAISALLNIKMNDFSYGPRIFPAFLLPYLSNVNEEINFGFQTFLLAINHRLQLPLRIIKFDAMGPKDVQKGSELIAYRIRQLEDELRGLRIGGNMTLLENKVK